MIAFFKQILLAQVVFLLFMSLFRVAFFVYYNPLESLDGYYFDLLKSFFLGLRIDLTVVSYLQLVVNIFLVLYLFLDKKRDFIKKLTKYFLFFSYVFVTILLISDFAFYSYFKEHINILFFGLFDDDTKALLKTFWQNYPVVWILFFFFLYVGFLYKILDFIFSLEFKDLTFRKKIYSLGFFIVLFLLTFLAARGSLGIFPLGRVIPTVSDNEFINKLAQNGVRAFIKAYKLRVKNKNNTYDLIKETGFDKNISEAFTIFFQKPSSANLNALVQKTSKKDIKEYNLVVIMVESFGMPILKYQSNSFDIMGPLKKHFQNDILFKNFISSGNGTIASLESLVLGIPYRPGTFPISQSKFATTSFSFAPAFVLKKAGYETSFVYGGDTNWREIGRFLKHQGFKNIIGKLDIYKNIKKRKDKEYFHPWGVYDEFLYEYILNRLKNSKKKQFIFALTTNNHPPYTIPKQFKLPNLKINDDLKKVLQGDMNLLKKRFFSYAYALHSLGIFLDKLKDSNLSKNTVVVVTADNNTIEGNMKYEKNPLFTSKNIPFYIYLPKELQKTYKHKSCDAFGSHKDIFPTIFNILLSQKEFLSVGKDLFDLNQTHIGVNGAKIAVSKKRAVKIKDLKKRQKFFEGNYYRALLAVTEYLLRTYENRK